METPRARVWWGRVLFPALDMEHTSSKHLDVRNRRDANKREIEEAAPRAGSLPRNVLGEQRPDRSQVQSSKGSWKWEAHFLSGTQPGRGVDSRPPDRGTLPYLLPTLDYSWASYSPLARSRLSLTLPATDASRCSQTSRFPWPCESAADGVAHRFDPDPIRQPTPKTDVANPSARHRPGLS